MSILLRIYPLENATCELCGKGWDDCELYRCDYCQSIICEDCKARITDPEFPQEICVDCMENN